MLHNKELAIDAGADKPVNLIKVLSLFVVAHLMHHLVTALGVPLLPLIRSEFSLDYTQAGLLMSAFPVSYGVGQLACGWLGDFFSRRKLLLLGLVGPALASLAVGISPSYPVVAVCMVGMGLSGGGYHPAASPLIYASVPERHLGKALGMHIIGGSASYFLAPLVGVAIAVGFGWRGAFIGLALPTILFAVLFNYLLRGRERAQAMQAKAPSGDPAHSHAHRGWLPRLVTLLVLASVTQAVLQSAIPFVPLYLVDHFKVDVKTAAVLLSLVYSAGLWGAPLGGYLSDRLGKVPMLVAMCLASGPVIFLLNVVPYGVGFGALLILIGMVMMMRAPIAEAFLVAEAPERYRSTVLGIYFFSAMEGGGVLTPLMGYLIDKFGFYTSFTIFSVSLVIFVLLGAALLWAWRRPGGRDNPESGLK